MIDRPVYSDRVRVTDATERSVKDAVVWHDSMCPKACYSSTTHSKEYGFTKRVQLWFHQKTTYFKGVV